MLIESIEVDFDIFDDAVERCLPGFAPRGWVEFVPERQTRARTVYQLRQHELGKVGCVTTLRRGDKLSALDIDEPSGSTDDEAVDYFGRLHHEAQDKIDVITNTIGRKPPADVRAMIILGIVEPEQVEVNETQYKDNRGQSILAWKIQIPDDQWPTIRYAARDKVSEWRKALDEKRLTHHRLVVQALFNRLYAEEIWPLQLLFSGKCKDSTRLIADMRAFVGEHMPPQDKEQALFSGSVEIVGDPPRHALIFADTHGAGRLMVGRLDISPFPDSIGESNVKCYAKNAWGILDWTHNLFSDILQILTQREGVSSTIFTVFQAGSQQVNQSGSVNINSRRDIQIDDVIGGNKTETS